MKKVWGNNQVNLRDDFHFYTSTLSVHLSLKANTTTANRCSLIYIYCMSEKIIRTRRIDELPLRRHCSDFEAGRVVSELFNCEN